MRYVASSPTFLGHVHADADGIEMHPTKAARPQASRPGTRRQAGLIRAAMIATLSQLPGESRDHVQRLGIEPAAAPQVLPSRAIWPGSSRSQAKPPVPRAGWCTLVGGAGVGRGVTSAVCLVMQFATMDRAKYDAVMKALDWQNTGSPTSPISHMAGPMRVGYTINSLTCGGCPWPRSRSCRSWW